MPVTIEYDNPLEQAEADALKQGLVFCDLMEPKSIRVVYGGAGTSAGRAAAFNYKLKNMGAKFDMKNRHYLVDLTVANLKELEHYFDDLFEPTERLDEWGYAQIDKLASLDNLTSADSDAELSPHFAEEAPIIARMLKPYQRAGIAFGVATRTYGLFDEPGLGKTLQTLGTVVESRLEGDFLVLAPTAAVAITWPDEIRKWLPDDEHHVINGPGPKRKLKLDQLLSSERAGKRRWIIVNLEMARAKWIKPGAEIVVVDGVRKKKWVKGWWDYSYPQLFLDEPEIGPRGGVKEVKHVWSGVVVDESHRALICHTPQAWEQTLVRAGMGKLVVRSDGLKIALSGTPMRGKPQNLWGTLNWLDPDKYHEYWAWVQRWFMTYDVENGGGRESKLIDGLDEAKVKDFYQDIKPYFLRRTKKEVRKELPDKLYAGTPLPDENGFVDENSPVGHWIEMSPKQHKAYEEIRRDAETRLDSGVLAAIGYLAELTRLKQFATCYGDIEQRATFDQDSGETYLKDFFAPSLPSAKFDWLVEFLDELGINKHSSMEPDGEIRKVVVTSQFTSILDMFDRELQAKGIKTLKITGKVNAAGRVKAAHTWQAEGGPRVFLLNTMAGGVSLTLDNADDLVLLDETWIPDDQEQVEDRIHRMSRLHQVTIHYLRSLGTVEETIALTTGSRERMTKRLLDGERGASYAKALLTPIKRK